MLMGEPFYYGNEGMLPWQNLRFWFVSINSCILIYFIRISDVLFFFLIQFSNYYRNDYFVNLHFKEQVFFLIVFYPLYATNLLIFLNYS